MNPNDQQGFYRPNQGQPVSQPPQPQPAEPVGVPEQASTPVAPQPAPAQQAPTIPAEPQPAGAVEPDPVSEDEYEDAESSTEPITWSAHEYIHQDKGTGWFVLFTIITLALIGISLWTQAWLFTALIVVIVIVIIINSRRPPRELTYTLSDDGMLVDDKLYKFEEFKSFGIIRDGDEFSVMLIPTQRFQPGVTVYFPEEAGEDIVDMLGSRLPMKDLKLDAVDRLVRLLRL